MFACPETSYSVGSSFQNKLLAHLQSITVKNVRNTSFIILANVYSSALFAFNGTKLNYFPIKPKVVI